MKTVSSSHLLMQVFPGNLLPPTYSKPDNPSHLLARSEVERRTDYIQPLCKQLGEEHPLFQLVCQCLHNIPAQRPSAEVLLERLEAVRPQVEGAFGCVEMETAKLQVAMLSVFKVKIKEKDSEIEDLHHDLLQVQVRACRLRYEACDCNYMPECHVVGGERKAAGRGES